MNFESCKKSLKVLKNTDTRLKVEAQLFGPTLAGDPIARNPKFLKYHIVRNLLSALPGVAKKDLRELLTAVQLESGSKDDPVSWKNPDGWIRERLDTHEMETAVEIFERTNKSVNPARIYGSHLLIKKGSCLVKRVFPEIM